MSLDSKVTLTFGGKETYIENDVVISKGIATVERVFTNNEVDDTDCFSIQELPM